jgi:hypothetical protein
MTKSNWIVGFFIVPLLSIKYGDLAQGAFKVIIAQTASPPHKST